MIMVLDIIAAPALVPARTSEPSSTRACSSVSTRVPPRIVAIRSWSPPVKNTPVAPSSAPSQDCRMDGTVGKGFEPVRDAFEAVLAPPGAAVAAWYDGRWVVDLWGGDGWTRD